MADDMNKPINRHEHLKGVDRPCENSLDYRIIFNATSNGMAFTDADSGKIIDVNTSWLAATGFVYEEVIGKTALELGLWADPVNRAACFAELKNKGHVADFESSLILKSIETPHLISAQFVEMDGRRYLLWEFRNIAGQKQSEDKIRELLSISEQSRQSLLSTLEDMKHAEEALRESKDQFRKVVENSPLSMALVGLNGVIEYINLKAIETFGYLPQDIPTMDRWWVQAYPDKTYRDEVIAQWMGLVEEALKHNHEIEQREYRVTCKNGSVKVMAIFGVWIADKVLVIFDDITESKKTEDALRSAVNSAMEEKAKTEAVIAAMGDAVSIQDTSYKILYQNQVSKDIYGDHVGEYCYRAYQNRAHVCQGCHLTRTFSDGMIHRMEQSRNTDKGVRYYDITASPIKDFTGKIISGIELVRDITERKKAEIALKNSENMLQAIIDTEPECIKLIDADANLIMMNRAGLDMLQVDTLEQVKGQCVCPMVVSAHWDAFMDLTKRVFKGESGTLVFEMIGLKGRHLWLETRAVPFKNEKDEIVALLAVTRDITESRKAAEELRKSNALSQSIINSSKDCIKLLDLDGRLIYMSPGGQRLLGIKEMSNYLNVPYDQFWKGSDQLSAQQAISQAQQGYTGRFQGYCPTVDGSPRWWDVIITPIRDALGNPDRLLAVSRDITEQKNAEEQRVKLEEQLRRSQKLEAVGTLAGGIAHDFNNLLQGVFGYISMAKIVHDQKEKSLAMLEQAEKALHLSVNLTAQLLTFSKGGSPVKKLVKLLPVIETAVKFSLSGSNVAYHINIDESLWSVNADDGQISQVIQNIVLNADQAMPLGGTIDISAQNVVAPGDGVPMSLAHGKYVLISIKDTGVGIPEGYLSRIFDPYYTTKEKGSGLGLATSYSIIKNHGGLIEVSSVIGKGTLFTIYIPAAENTAEYIEQPAVSKTVKKGKILVMDDEQIVCDIAGELIRALGHEVEIAKQGEEAIEKYRSAKESGSPFNAVILDLTIRGGMGGKETLEHLLAIDNNIRAIVSSGYSDDAVISDYQKYGFKACLSKPYRIEELRDSLNAVLS